MLSFARLEIHSALEVEIKESEAQMWQLTPRRSVVKTGNSRLKDWNSGKVLKRSRRKESAKSQRAV